MSKSLPVKHFVIYPEPNAADPAWITPVYEGTDGGPIMWSDTEAIQKEVFAVRDRLNRHAGHHEGVLDALNTLGIPYDEYAKAKIKPQKQSSDNVHGQ